MLEDQLTHVIGTPTPCQIEGSVPIVGDWVLDVHVPDEETADLQLSVICSPVQWSGSPVVSRILLLHVLDEQSARLQASVSCSFVQWSYSQVVCRILIRHLGHDDTADLQLSLLCSTVQGSISGFVRGILVLSVLSYLAADVNGVGFNSSEQGDSVPQGGFCGHPVFEVSAGRPGGQQRVYLSVTQV